jgi:hypothetical protein
MSDYFLGDLLIRLFGGLYEQSLEKRDHDGWKVICACGLIGAAFGWLSLLTLPEPIVDHSGVGYFGLLGIPILTWWGVTLFFDLRLNQSGISTNDSLWAFNRKVIARAASAFVLGLVLVRTAALT